MKTTILLPLLLLSCLVVAGAQESEAVPETEYENEAWTEVSIIVHGITPHRTIREKDPSYERFFDNLQQSFFRLNLHHQFEFPFDRNHLIEIYYGSKNALELSGDNPSNNLEQLQQIIGEFDAQIWNKTEDDPDSLLRATAFKSIRELMLYGISDAFYYNSNAGGKAIRTVILKQVFRGLRENNVLNSEGILPEPEKLSVTIFAHSLGAIVMYDLLQFIFDDTMDPANAVDDLEAQMVLDGFFRLKKAGRIRIRKFYSMGTQIPVMYLKYEDSVDMLMSNKVRDVHHIFPADDSLPDPRWLNLWDKDDILGYPCQYLFNKRPESGTRILKDFPVDAGDYLPHIAYWWTPEVAEIILLDYLNLSKDEIYNEER